MTDDERQRRDMMDFRRDDELRVRLLASILVGGKPNEAQRAAWREMETTILDPLWDVVYGPVAE